MNLAVGAVLESTRRDEPGRVVEVVADHGNGYVSLKNASNGRVSRASKSTVQRHYRARASRAETPRAETPPARHLAPLTTERERELVRIIKAKFSNFIARGQHYYLGGGMSTSHVVVTVMADVQQIHLFWPKELVHRNAGGAGLTYRLDDRVFERVQDAIRDTLNGLEKKGYVQKVGNTDERRWKPTYRDA